MQAPSISILDVGNGRYRVEIQAAHPSTHDIAMPVAYPTALGLEGVPAARIVEESMRFLLERESNTAILRTFSLSEIARYFPEYPAEIARRLTH